MSVLTGRHWTFCESAGLTGVECRFIWHESNCIQLLLSVMCTVAVLQLMSILLSLCCAHLPPGDRQLDLELDTWWRMCLWCC